MNCREEIKGRSLVLVTSLAPFTRMDHFRSSYSFCKFSQNSALVPKKCASRKALSPAFMASKSSRHASGALRRHAWQAASRARGRLRL